MDFDAARNKRDRLLANMKARQDQMINKKKLREAAKENTSMEQSFMTSAGPQDGPYRFFDSHLIDVSAITPAKNQSLRFGAATSTPLAARNLCGSTSSIEQVHFSHDELQTKEERLEHQFAALAAWANTILKSDVLGHEIDNADLKANANKDLLNVLTQLQRKPSETTRNYSEWAQNKALDEYRAKCREYYISLGIEDAAERIIASDAIRVHPDKRLFLDIEQQSRILSILFSFHPFWLHMGFELIFDRNILLEHGERFATKITRICRDFLFVDERLLKLKKTTLGGNGNLRLTTDEGTKLLHNHILRKLFMFFMFVEGAKKNSIVPRAPGMFGRKSEYRELKDVFAEISRNFVQSHLPLYKVFRRAGFEVSFVQPFYEFYLYRVNNFEDVGDGIVLGRMVEYLFGLESNSLMSKLRSPSGDRLRKIGNVTTVLNALQSKGMNIGKLTASQIVGLHKESILELLWRLVGFYVNGDDVATMPVVHFNAVEPADIKKCRRDLLARCENFGKCIGLEVNGFRSIRDGSIFSQFWSFYTKDQPPLDEFEGENTWEKVYNAAHLVLGVPKCVVQEDDRSLTLFTIQFLRRLVEFGEDHQEETLLQGSETATQYLSATEETDRVLVNAATFVIQDNNTMAVVDGAEITTPQKGVEQRPSSTNANLEPMIKNSSSTSSIEGKPLDLYTIDIDEMVERQDQEMKERMNNEEVVVNHIETGEVDDLVDDLAESANMGLVKERMILDGETSIGWREAEPDEEVGKTGSPVNEEDKENVHQATDSFQQFLPQQVPSRVDFTKESQKELVHEPKDDAVDMDVPPPLILNPTILRVPSDYANKKLEDPLVGIYKQIKLLEQEQAEIAQKVSVLTSRNFLQK